MYHVQFFIDDGNIDEQVTSENENEEDAAKESSSDNVFQSNTRSAAKKDSVRNFFH